MYTGYFGKMKIYPKDKGYDYVSIAKFNKFWKGKEYKKLAPPAEIIKIENKEVYTKLYYERVLNTLDPKVVYNELGENAVLLCYEKYDDIKSGKTFCHRNIVAEWLKNKLGVEIKELENEDENNNKQLHF